MLSREGCRLQTTERGKSLTVYGTQWGDAVGQTEFREYLIGRNVHTEVVLLIRCWSHLLR